MFIVCLIEYACVGGEIRTVVCKSPNNALGYKACRVGDGNKIIRDAWLVTPRSPVQCNYFPGKHPNYQGAGGAWGYHDNILWTAKGCNSMFGVCLGIVFSSNQGGSFSIWPYLD